MSRSKIGAIVTDVEGTATSIAFVREKLFPYARAHLSEFVETHADDPKVARHAPTAEYARSPRFHTHAKTTTVTASHAA